MTVPGFPGFPFDVAMAPANVAAAFTAQMLPLVEKIRANITESRTLAATRDALLPRLLSGDVRVPQGVTEKAGVGR